VGLDANADAARPLVEAAKPTHPFVYGTAIDGCKGASRESIDQVDFS